MNTRLDSATCDGDRAKLPNVSELVIEVQGPADPFVEPLSLLSSRLGEITSLILQLERNHLEQMENAATQLRADLENGHRSQYETGIQVLREEFEARLRSATAQWEAERQSLLNEIEHLRQRNSPELAQEMAQTEAALEGIQKKIREMVDDPTAELSRVMQENARQQELQGYLKGLKFNV
jgi:DNA anti-recombination protein RmuC